MAYQTALYRVQYRDSSEHRPDSERTSGVRSAAGAACSSLLCRPASAALVQDLRQGEETLARAQGPDAFANALGDLLVKRMSSIGRRTKLTHHRRPGSPMAR